MTRRLVNIHRNNALAQKKLQLRSSWAVTATVLGAWLLAVVPLAAVEFEQQMFTSAAQADNCLLQLGATSCTMDFVIDTVPHALVIVTSSSKTLSVSLTDPAANVTPIGSTGPGITGSGTAPVDADVNPLVTGKDYLFRLADPQPGLWTVNVSDASVTEDTPVVVNVWMRSEVAGFMVGGGETYPLGAEVRLGLVMVDGTALLSGYTIDATVFRLEDATFTPVAVSFADGGVAPDDTAADGMYSGSIVLNEAGEYHCRAVVNGTSGAVAFRRDLLALFTVNAQNATLVAASLSDTGVDTNGNTLYNHIAMSIDVDAAVAGDYSVTMNLRSAGGKTASATATSALPAGVSTVQVLFDHEVIRKLGENGPYDVSVIRLDKILPDQTALQDLIFDAGQTTAYLLSQLERGDILFTAMTDSGVDCDMDGDFDRLDIELTVDVLVAGTYQYSMALLDSEGNEIEFIAGSAVLAVGPNPLTLEFTGADIGVHGADGPYTVGGVLVSGPGGASVVAGTVGSTFAYMVSEFETPVITQPYNTGFENFNLGQVWGQQGWALSAGPAPSAAVISTTSPHTGTRSLEIRRDPNLADNTLWGVFTPVMTPARDLKQEVSVWIQIEAAAGPDYEVMIQSPTDGFVSVWMRFKGNGDVQVLTTFGSFLSTGFNWLNEIGAGEYFKVTLTSDTQAPTTTQINVAINGITVFNGGHVGSDFLEQLVFLTNNTGPNDVALFVDDILLQHEFLLSDCDSDGEPDACQAVAPDCPACGDGTLDPGEQCDDGNTSDSDGCSSICEVQVSDDCDLRLTLLEGTTAFTTIGTTTDGPNYFNQTDCGPFGDNQVYNDIWYNYTASCSGQLMVTTCEQLGGSANYDTRISAHNGCGNSPTCPSGPVIACNDDDLVNPCGDQFHSTLVIPVVQGNCYKVRVGGFGTTDEGTGVLLAECTGTVCGDGITEGAEQCDDDNQDNGDGCASNCILEVCGNGIPQAGEECDDGDTIDNNNCTNACELATCGDGIVWNQGAGGEACDDGDTIDNNDCTNACELATCGDGITWNQGAGDEECDDGDGINGNDCTNACTAATCGDGITWNQGSGTETCDDGDSNDNNDCTTACEAAACGDGIVWNEGTGDEECDDGDGVDGNDCTNACTAATCGDGVVWNQGAGDEACDDGDANNNNDCTSACEAATCGDGITWNQGSGTEQCDDGDLIDNNDCTTACALPACGDGILWDQGTGNEQCDDGDLIANNDCTNACLPATCGDGVTWDQGTGTEECDDGDLIDNNNCTTACELASCGDGITWDQGTGTEQCDDGDVIDSNDCTTACALPACGDGILWDQGSGNEQCDDGDAVDNNDCTNACLPASCGDGVTWDQGSGTEECDDGNTTPGDGCDENCISECLVGCLADAECDNDDVCTFDACDLGAQCCTAASRPYGDTDNDGAVDLTDTFCVLDCFAGEFSPSCTLMNTDLAPCPGGDGQCDIDDILRVIDATFGADYCSCGAP